LQNDGALLIKGKKFDLNRGKIMKKDLFTLSVLFLLLCGAAFAQSEAARTEDEKAIRANVKQMETGWNAKSGAEFAKPFAEDADYVVINGFHIKGRAASAESHQRIFDTIFKNTNLTLAVEQIRFLRPDVAVVHVFGRRKPAQKTDPPQLTRE
jgi:uncharacterized protein (TIGR02246 family)